MSFTHLRAVWQNPALPVKGPTIDWAAIDTVAIHYTAADDLIDGDPGEHADDLPAYLRAIQRDYTVNRGYSTGYNAAVDWLGGTWELRGVDIKCAANAGHNGHTWAILVLVDGADPTTLAGAAAIRGLVAEAERCAGRHLTIKGHRELPAATGCPGAGLLTQIHAGLFSPRWQPTPPLDEEDIVKLWQDPRYHNVFGTNGGGWIHLSPALAASFAGDGAVKVVEQHDQTLRSAMAGSGITSADLVPV